jgi:hypothetical protein
MDHSDQHHDERPSPARPVVPAGGEPGEGAGDTAVRPRLVDVADAADREDEERILRNAWPPLSKYIFDWLQTPDGAEMARQVTGLLESLRRETIGRQHTLAVIDVISRYGLMVLLVGAAVYLRAIDKLDTVMVGFFSAGLGFLFGRQKAR